MEFRFKTTLNGMLDNPGKIKWEEILFYQKLFAQLVCSWCVKRVEGKVFMDFPFINYEIPRI